jgi:hypothetical protein
MRNSPQIFKPIYKTLMLSNTNPPTTLRGLNYEVQRAKAILPQEQHQWLDKYYGWAYSDVMLRDIDESYAVKNAWESIESTIKKHAK